MRSCLVEWAKIKRLEDKGIISSSDFDTWRKMKGARNMGRTKEIVCLETGKQFNSVENAANAIGVSSGLILLAR